MTLFDRYILGQVLRPMGLALLIALLVFLIERMLQLLDLVLGASGPVKIFFEIIGYLVPHYLSMALPLSLLLGVMVAFNRLSREGEIEAMQSAGISLFRQALAPIIAAIIVAAIAAGTLGYLKPYARYAYESVVFSVSNAAFQALLRPGVFTRFGDVTFLIEGVKPDGTGVTRVFLYEEDANGNASAIAARNGNLVRSDYHRVPVLRLFDGVRFSTSRAGSTTNAKSDADTGLEAERAPRADAGTENGPGIAVNAAQSTGQDTFAVLRFQELRKTLSDDHAMFFRPRGNHEREMTIDELWRYRNDPPEGIRSSDVVAEFHSRLVQVATIPLLPLIAVALGLGRQRSARYFGIAAGVLAVVVYNQVIDFGKNLAESEATSPFVGLWLPFLVFAAMSLLLFYRTATRVPSTPMFARLDAVLAPVRRLLRLPIGRDATT
jgi:lipopolysaccharide export system permease protein